MLKELVQFIDDIPASVKDRAREPNAGLHILIRFDERGLSQVVDSEYYMKGKQYGTSRFLKECAAKQYAAWMIDTNKCFDLPMKGLHSASPYCIAFKRESWIGGSKYPSDRSKPNILERLESYFEKTFEEKFNLDETEKQRAIQFKEFLKNKMGMLLEAIPEYVELEWSDYIILYRDEPLEKYRQFQDTYLAGGLFNTADYNIQVEGDILGTSNFYNGFNSKKPFLTHQTASFDITSRISTSDAKALSEFQVYARKKLFPNPTPIFIDEPELTKEAIKFYHRSEGNEPSHREIVTELLNKYKKDLGNYYLLYFSGGAIRDFDFVSKFRYYLSDKQDESDNRNSWAIKNLMEITNLVDKKTKKLLRPIELKTVFDLEREVIGRLFDYKLSSYDERKGASFKYFNDLDAKWYRPAMFSLLLKYRKPVYDYIYKSMRTGITGRQFEDICMTGIIDDIKNHESTKEYAIKSKLNIYFSLYQYFEKNNIKQIMPSKIEEHKSLMARIVEDENVHFDSDEGYAFGAGQLIYYLLSKSEAGERTHAMLEPFLQKTNHDHFNEAIANLLLKYKHAIGFDFKRFNQLAGEVLDYIPKEKRLTELKPYLLAGYFSPNILFKSKRTEVSS